MRTRHSQVRFELAQVFGWFFKLTLKVRPEMFVFTGRTVIFLKNRNVEEHKKFVFYGGYTEANVMIGRSKVFISHGVSQFSLD